MNKLFIMVVCVLAFIIQCNITEVEHSGWKDTPDPQIALRDSLSFGDVIFQIPSCIKKSGEQSSKMLLKKSVEDTIAFGTYSGIRSYIGLCDNMALLASDIIKQFSTCRDTVFNADGIEARLRINEDNNFKNSFHVWDSSSKKKILELFFNKYSNGIDGYFIYNYQRLLKITSDTFTYVKVEFNSRNNSNIMKVSITNAYTDQSSSTNPKNIMVSVYKKDDILEITGGTYHTKKNIATDINPWCYIFRGKANNASNKAVLEVALAPVTFTDKSSVYDSCSVFNLTKKYVTDNIYSRIIKDKTLAAIFYASVKLGKKVPDSLYYYKNDPNADTTRLLQDDINPYIMGSAKDSISSNSILEFLNLNKHISAWAKELETINQGTQPVYFSGSTGYLSHGSQAPQGFPFISSDTKDVETVMPSDVCELTLGFADSTDLVELEE